MCAPSLSVGIKAVRAMASLKYVYALPPLLTSRSRPCHWYYYLNYTIPYTLVTTSTTYLVTCCCCCLLQPRPRPPRHLKHLFLFISLSFFVLSLSPAIRTDIPSGLTIRLEWASIWNEHPYIWTDHPIGLSIHLDGASPSGLSIHLDWASICTEHRYIECCSSGSVLIRRMLRFK